MFLAMASMVVAAAGFALNPADVKRFSATWSCAKMLATDAEPGCWDIATAKNGSTTGASRAGLLIPQRVKR